MDKQLLIALFGPLASVIVAVIQGKKEIDRPAPAPSTTSQPIPRTALVVVSYLAIGIAITALLLVLLKPHGTSATELPIGSIVAWSGKGEIPDGWAICDGDKETGTPNLRDLFLRGVIAKADAGKTDDKQIKTKFISTEGGRFPLACVDAPAPTSAAESTTINIPPNYSVIYIMRIK